MQTPENNDFISGSVFLRIGFCFVLFRHKRRKDIGTILVCITRQQIQALGFYYCEIGGMELNDNPLQAAGLPLSETLAVCSAEFQAYKLIWILLQKVIFVPWKSNIFSLLRVCAHSFPHHFKIYSVQNHGQKHKETKLFFLLYSMYYFSYDLTLQCCFTENALHGTVYIGSIIGKPSTGEEKVFISLSLGASR